MDAGPEIAAAASETNGVPIRIGYARCSTATQELQSQLDALAAAHCTRVFSEKISTRIKIRPELEKALTLAHEGVASPGRLGLVSLGGTVVAPRPNRSWRGKSNAGGERRR